MNTATIARTLGALAISIAIGACGTTAPSPTPSPDTADRGRTEHDVAPPAPSLCPSQRDQKRSGPERCPSVSPDATARLWYPAVAGTGTGEPPYISAEFAAALGLTPGHARQRPGAAPCSTPRPRPDRDPRPGHRLDARLGRTNGGVHGPCARTWRATASSCSASTPPSAPRTATNCQPTPQTLARRLDQLSTASIYSAAPTSRARWPGRRRTRIAAGGHPSPAPSPYSRA